MVVASQLTTVRLPEHGSVNMWILQRQTALYFQNISGVKLKVIKEKREIQAYPVQCSARVEYGHQILSIIIMMHL